MHGQRSARHDSRFGVNALRGARIVLSGGRRDIAASAFQPGPIYATWVRHRRGWSSPVTPLRSGEGGPHPLAPSPFGRGGTQGGRMNAQLRRRLEMAGRVREFLRAHKMDGVGEGLGLAKLEELLTRAEVLASQQRSGVVATRAAKREHIGASADLEAVAAEVAEQVKVLDGLVRYRFGDDAELMGAWASARNVLGPFKPKAGDQPKAA